MTRAVAGDPKSIDARMDLAYDLTQQNRLPESLEHFREAVRLDPGLFSAQFALGQNLLRVGQFDEAIEQLSAAVRLRPADASAESHLAAACQQRGRLAEAAAHYRNVLKRQPDFVPALMGLAVVCSSATQSDVRDRQEALRLAVRACELTKHADPESLTILATVYAQAGCYAEAGARDGKAWTWRPRPVTCSSFGRWSR